MPDTEFEQLVQAVKREPGSRAFALLAERHLKRGEAEQALEVCTAGFEVNPAYERGAVVFLEVLGQLDDISRASEVYGRSIAEHPRSSELRLAWAKLLKHAGRDYEARLRAKEAAELAPESKEARALLASLSATPPPARRKTGGIAARPPAAVGGIREKVAALKPRPGSATHGRFDFTPTPAFVEPPAGVDKQDLGAKADFFDVSDQAGAGRVQIEVAPPPPASGAPFSGAIDPTRTSSENLFGGSPPPPAIPESPEIEALPPSTPPIPPPAPLTPPPTPPEEPAAPAPPEPAPPEPAPPEPAPPAPGLPEQQVAVAIIPDVSEVEEAPASEPLLAAPDTLPPTKRARRRWWLFPLAAVLMATPVAGSLIYRQAKQRALRETLKTTMAAVRGDRLPSWLHSRNQACKAAAQHKRSAAAHVACALFTAHLVARFSRDNFAAPLEEHLRSAQRLAPEHPWTQVAALLRTLARHPEKLAEANLAKLPATAKDWHVSYARLRIHLAKGDAERALKEIAPLDDQALSAALLKATLRIARLQGDTGRRDELLKRGLRLFPSHPGLLLEEGFATPEQGAKGIGAKLREAVETIPSLRADLDLLSAHRAARKKAFGRAAGLAARAAKGAPHGRPEAAWRALFWQLEARAIDASQADQRSAKLYPQIKTLMPNAALQRARISILLGRSAAASELLEGLPAAALDAAHKGQRRRLAVRIAVGREELRSLKKLCPAHGISPSLLGACAESFLQLGKLSRLRVWLKRAQKHGGLSDAGSSLRAILALAAGDVERAASLLAQGEAKPMAPASRMLLIARAAIGSYQLDRAISTLREAVSAEHGSARTRLALAKALVLRGNDSEARELLGAIEEAQPTDPATLAAMGEAWIALGNTDRAAAIAKKGNALHRDKQSLQILSARIALANRRFTRARRILSRLLKRSPHRPEVHLDLGQIALHRGREGRASKHFSRALKTRPKDPSLRLSLAIAYARAGKHRQALPHAKYAIGFFERAKQHGRALDALITVGKLLAKGKQAARKTAEELLFRASTKSGAPPDAFYHLGLVHKANGDAPRAIWCFKQVLRRAPKMALAHLQLGLVQLKKRKWRRKGRKALKRYLDLAPKGPKARKVRAILARHR